MSKAEKHNLRIYDSTLIKCGFIAMGGLGLIFLLESFSPFSIIIPVGDIKKQRL